MSEYAKRDFRGLGVYYTGHVSAMTAEDLHEKCDIAAELAFRDKRFIELCRAIIKAFGEHAVCADGLFHVSADDYNEIVRIASMEE